jgi:NADH-quinone oxidoreductase subunit E
MSFRSAPLTVPAPSEVKEGLFDATIRAAIDAHVARYPAEWKQSAVMPALTLVQDWNGGWLSRELMDDVARYLDMPAIAVYEVATFYNMYDLEPTAKNKVCVCNSISCMLNGSEELIAHVEHNTASNPARPAPMAALPSRRWSAWAPAGMRRRYWWVIPITRD